MNKVHRGSTFCHAEVAEPSQRLKEQKEFALFLAGGRRRQWTACLDDPLNPVCVNVQVKNLFYLLHKFGFPDQSALLLYCVKLTSLFFTFCRTVSYEMLSVIFNCSNQRFRSFGVRYGPAFLDSFSPFIIDIFFC